MVELVVCLQRWVEEGTGIYLQILLEQSLEIVTNCSYTYCRLLH